MNFLLVLLSIFFYNIVNIPTNIAWEMGLIVPIIGVVGLFSLFKKNWKLGSYILIWLFVPFIIISFFGKVVFPRYVIYLGTILLIGASYYLAKIREDRLKFLLILIFISIAYTNYCIWFDHKNIPFPPVDRGQYLEGWTAGWGAREIVEHVKTSSADKPSIILASGNFGMTGDVLEVFRGSDSRIQIKGVWPINKEDVDEVRKSLQTHNVFVVLSHEYDYSKQEREWGLEVVKLYEKPGKISRMGLFEVK